MATFQSPTSETMGLPGAYAQVARARQSAMISQVRVPPRGLRGVTSPGLRGTTPDSRDTITVNVRDLQRFLAQAGFSPGAVDGVYGPRTERALDSFVTTTVLNAGESLQWRAEFVAPGRVLLAPKRIWAMLQTAAVQRQQAADRARRSAAVAPSIPGGGSGAGTQTPEPTTPPAPGSGGGWGWIGVAVAAAAVVGIGAVVMMGR